MIIDRASSVLLIIDFQARLVPAIHGCADIVGKAKFLAEVARQLKVPTIVTEENPVGLGQTIPELQLYAAAPVEKRSFDASRGTGLPERLPAERRMIIVTGCEAHVCVLQTVLGLVEKGYSIFLVDDAIGSRHPGDKAAAVARMAAHKVEVVTAEMVAFEWLGSCDDAKFKAILQLIKLL